MYLPPMISGVLTSSRTHWFMGMKQLTLENASFGTAADDRLMAISEKNPDSMWWKQ